MATLLQSITTLIENVTVTDRQETNIANSVKNLNDHLTNSENNLSVLRTFTNGSYERDTIIRPLNDVDIFCVLDKDEWKDEYGRLPNPQSVLTQLKNYLNGINDYKDKVSQDRPCVTISLSDKDFDVLPSFQEAGGGYQMPNYDLQTWTWTFPEQLTTSLNNANKTCNYRLKGVIRAIKHWNRENSKLIPSFHIEETAISLFSAFGFKNEEEAIRKWFNYSTGYFDSSKFKSQQQCTDATNIVKKVKEKLNEAKVHLDNSSQSEAIKIWKEVFGKQFPSTDIEEAKLYSKQLTEGTLKFGSAGISATVGNSVKASKGFYGDEVSEN
jgi:Second Messenger Oligonucleotide or Dinucleotide Synthetase domain